MMTGASRCLVMGIFVAAAACGTGGTRVDPAGLELRDLLGVSPETASHWDADQRAAARRVLVAALHDRAPATRVELGTGPTIDDRVARAFVVLDDRRIA